MASCWYNFSKYMLIALNIVFLAVSVVVIALVTWILSDKTFLVSIAEEEDNYNAGLYIFLGAGILMFFVAFLGCCGAIRHYRCCLISFASIMLVIIGAQIAFGSWLYGNSSRIDELLRSSVINTVKNEYGEMDCRTQIIDAVQINLECCGANGPEDWAGSKYARQDSFPLSITVSNNSNNKFKIPESCCRESDRSVCDEIRYMKIAGIVDSGIYSEGCTEKLLDALKDQSYHVLVATTLVFIMEIFGLVFALICFCEDVSPDRYKA